MSKASGSIDLKSLKVAGEANKYITAIDENGVKVHAANNINLNYTQITSEGMEVFKTNGATSNPSAISVAKFGEIVRIGKESAAVLYIEPGRITSVLGDKKLFEFGTDTNTPYIEKKHEIQVVGNTDFTYNIPKGYLVEGMKFGVSITQGTSGGYLPPDYDITYGTDGTATIYVQNGSTNARVTITYNFTNNTIVFGSWYSCSDQYKYRLVIWFKIPNIEPVFILGNNFAGLYSSVAEGENTSAYGYAAHSEGYQTQANADYSHAQNENTIANRRAQTTVGTYNIEDNHSDTTHPSGIDTYGNYSVIIGNGTNSNNRSNALTVDWNGSINSYINCDTDSTYNTDTSGTTEAHYLTQFAVINSNNNKTAYIDVHKWSYGESLAIFGMQRMFNGANNTSETIQNQFGLGVKSDKSLYVWIPDNAKSAWRSALGFSKTQSTPTKTNSSVWISGSIELIKVGQIVTVKFNGVNFGATSTRTNFATIPEAYRPLTETGGMFDSSTIWFFVRPGDGSIAINQAAAGQRWGTVTYIAQF